MSAMHAPLKEHVHGFQRRSRSLFVVPDRKVRRQNNEPESELVKFGETLLEAAQQYRDGDLGMKHRWQSYRKWYLGESPGRSLTYSNMIYEVIEKLAADLSDSRPVFQFDPNRPQDLQMSNYLNDAIPWVWDQHDLQAEYHDTVKGTGIFGNWYWKTIHDPRFMNQGSVERTNSIAPWYIFPAPYATNPEEAPWIIEVFPRTVGEIERDYGVKCDAEMAYGQFFPDISEDMDNQGIQGQFTTVATGPGGVPAGGQVVEGIPDSFLAGTTRDGVVLQKELWIRDGSTQEMFSKKEEENGLETLVRSYGAKYPKGRVISWANGRLLYDVPNPYADGRFPYVHFKDVTIPGFWYGMGEVQQLVNLQMLHNDTHEIMKQIHMFMAVGRTIVDKSTGLTPERMTNRPGDIWFVRDGTSDRVKHLGAQVPHAEFYQYLNLLENHKDLAAGIHDPSRGINPSGVVAGRALQTLQSAAGIRVKARFNDLERALIGWAKRTASRVQQFWPAETQVRVTGRRSPEDSAAFNSMLMRPDDRNAQYTVSVSSTANRDAAQAADFQKLAMLVQGMPGMIPPALLVKAANFSNQKEIEALLAQMSMQGAPAPSPGGQTPRPRMGQGVM